MNLRVENIIKQIVEEIVSIFLNILNNSYLHIWYTYHFHVLCLHDYFWIMKSAFFILFKCIFSSSFCHIYLIFMVFFLPNYFKQSLSCLSHLKKNQIHVVWCYNLIYKFRLLNTVFFFLIFLKNNCVSLSVRVRVGSSIKKRIVLYTYPFCLYCSINVKNLVY